MICLSDNDIIEKLAICDLLDDALTAFDAERSDVYVIPTLKYRFGVAKNREKVEQKLGAEVLTRILDFLASVQEIREYSKADHELLDDVVAIDAGEAILLSATAIFPEYRLFTGDKRCLKMVATCPECVPIAHRIKGNVVCFEQVLCRLIASHGFSHVLTKVVPRLHCDTALRAAFGSGVNTTEENALDCLHRYITELRRLPIDLLSVDA